MRLSCEHQRVININMNDFAYSKMYRSHAFFGLLIAQVVTSKTASYDVTTVRKKNKFFEKSNRCFFIRTP